jgi:hypothetical protein
MIKYESIYEENVIQLNENKKILSDNEVKSLSNKYDIDFYKLYVMINTYDKNGFHTNNKNEIVDYSYNIIYDDVFHIKSDIKHIYSTDENIPTKKNSLPDILKDDYDKILKLKKDLDKNYIYKVSKTSKNLKVKNNVVNKFKKNKLTRQKIVNDINNGEIINDVYTIWSNIQDDDDFNSLKDYISTIDFHSLSSGFMETFEKFDGYDNLTPNVQQFLKEIESIYKELGSNTRSAFKMKFSNIDRM